MKLKVEVSHQKLPRFIIGEYTFLQNLCLSYPPISITQIKVWQTRRYESGYISGQGLHEQRKRQAQLEQVYIVTRTIDSYF